MKLHSSDLANGSSKKPHPVPHCQAQQTSPCVLSPSKFNVMSSQSHVLHYRVLPPSELYVMSSHSHVSHCRVLPPGEFSVMSSQSDILQGTATWQIQCHDTRATCHIAGCCHPVNYMSYHPTTTCHIAGCCHLANSVSCHPRATCYTAGCCHLVNSMS